MEAGKEYLKREFDLEGAKEDFEDFRDMSDDELLRLYVCHEMGRTQKDVGGQDT